jgi:hypothetical protein
MGNPTATTPRLVFVLAQDDNFDDALLHYEIEVSAEELDNSVHIHRAIARAQLEGYFDPRAFDESTPAGRTLAGWMDKRAMRAQRDDEVVGSPDAPLWRVPVSAMASLSADIKVRASDGRQAQALARQVAAQGYFPAGFSLDDAAFMRAGDYQVAEPERIDADEPSEEGDDNRPAGAAIASFKEELQAFCEANGQLIGEWEVAMHKHGVNLDDAHWDAIDDIKGRISESAANASSDVPDEQEAAIQDAEEWVSSSISQTGSTVALVLFTQGTDEGSQWLLRRLEDQAHRAERQRAS